MVGIYAIYEPPMSDRKYGQRDMVIGESKLHFPPMIIANARDSSSKKFVNYEDVIVTSVR